MIVVKLISGLGNQLFQYALGRRVALLKKVPLKMDLSFYSSQNLRGYKLEHYTINAQVATSADIDFIFEPERSLLVRVRKKSQKFLLGGHIYPILIKERGWWLYDYRIFSISRHAYLDGYWQHYLYYEHLPLEIFKELTLVSHLREEVSQEAELIVNSPNTVSIHVRRGDYVTDPEARALFGILPLIYYQRAIEYVASHLGICTFFIFSDDIEWAQQHIQVFNHACHFMTRSYSVLDCQELYLMSLCQHNIIANSSFSWWGAFLNKNSDKIVVAPKQWLADDVMNARVEVQMPTWVVV